MAIRLNKEECFEFDTVDEAIDFKNKMSGESIDTPKEIAEDFELAKKPLEFKHSGENKKGWKGNEIDFVIEFYRRNTNEGMLKKGKMGELSATIGRTEKSIAKLVTDLRKEGKIAPSQNTLARRKNEKKVERKPRGRISSWTDREDQMIIDLYEKTRAKGKARVATKKINTLCRKLKRSRTTVKGRYAMLRKAGKI